MGIGYRIPPMSQMAQSSSPEIETMERTKKGKENRQLDTYRLVVDAAASCELELLRMDIRSV